MFDAEYELKIIIRNMNPKLAITILDHLKSNGIVEIYSTETKNEDKEKKLNSIFATCADLNTKQHLLNNGLCVGFIHYTVDDYIKPPQIEQCSKCFSIDHTRNNCADLQHCSRCYNNHHREKCTVTEAVCVLCNGNHPSTYKGCPKIKMKIYQLRKQQQQTNNTNHTLNNLTETYASTTAKTTNFNNPLETLPNEKLDKLMAICIENSNTNKEIKVSNNRIHERLTSFEDSINKINTSLALTNFELKLRKLT